jgi:endoglucanase
VKKFLRLYLGLSIFLAVSVQANCLLPERLTGINLAGAEFNAKKLPGIFNKDYTYPTSLELSYIAAQRANVIRLPFRWERLQPEIDKPLNSEELLRLKTAVDSAHAVGLCVILDVHNYAKYYEQTLAGQALLQNAFINFWLLLAKEFNAPEKTIYGLMNEPIYMPQNEWTALAKRTLTALRTSNNTNFVMIGGGGWNGLHSWFKVKDGISNADAFAGLKDPLNRTIIEVHQYADSDYSGTTNECLPTSHFDGKFIRIQEWAHANQLKLFLGEFGVATSLNCLETLRGFLQLMAGSDWKGWTYWAGGRWWGDYSFALSTVEPVSAQWAVLKPLFYPVNPPMPPTANP